MLFNIILLAFSTSLDSFGIGITYGIKNIKISFFSKMILFFISFCITYISVIFGDYLSTFFSSFGNLIGSCILIFIGVIMLLKSLFEMKHKKTFDYDFNNSNLIDPKEALILAFALSMDSFGIGVSSSLINAKSIFFPFIASIFQYLFLTLGNLFGKFAHTSKLLPDCIWSIISSMLLILIGVIKFFV